MKKEITTLLFCGWHKTSLIILSLLFLSCKHSIINLDEDPNSTQDSSIFLAGASTANITPLSGTGTVHDSLYAKAIVLDDGSKRLAFIVADNQGLPSFVCQAAKEEIELQTGIPSDNIMISSTHTHSGVYAGQEINYYTRTPATLFGTYDSLVLNRMVSSVKKAVDNLQPAKIGWGSISKPQYVFNRRWYMQNQVYSPYGILDSVKMNPSFQDPNILTPAGPTDPQISFIAIKSTSNTPIAVLANYSLHYVGFVGSGHVSADYYGEFAKRLTTHLGANGQTIPFVGIMSNGTSGDVNANNYANAHTALPNYQKIETVAEDIASDIATSYNSIAFHNWVPLNALTKEITFNKRTPSNEELTNLALIEAHTGSTPLFNSQEKTYAPRLRYFMNNYPNIIPAKIQAFSIGDLAIGTAPFEIFAETGLELKSLSPFPNTFIIGIGNGHWGYLPTPKQHLKGGYETWITVNRVQKDASEILVDELISMFNVL